MVYGGGCTCIYDLLGPQLASERPKKKWGFTRYFDKNPFFLFKKGPQKDLRRDKNTPTNIEKNKNTNRMCSFFMVKKFLNNFYTNLRNAQRYTEI